MTGSLRLRQWWADLLASFWLRPSAMTVAAILLGQALVWTEGLLDLPSWAAAWVYAGGAAGARDVLGVVAGSVIAVAGTVFSITVAALTLASNQMGPRLLRNFTRDSGIQYALGAFVATFAYALVALRSIRAGDEGGAFVPQIALTVGLLFAFACTGVLIWFLHHLATSINVAQVIAEVSEDLSAVVDALPERDERRETPARRPGPPERHDAASLRAPGSGYLRVLDDGAMADWAVEHGAILRLRVRPGDFVFPGSVIGRVSPAAAAREAQDLLGRAMTLGRARTVEQDLEHVVRQLVEVALRALSPGINDPFTAISVLDRLGAAVCTAAGRALPDGCTSREGCVRVERPTTTYDGLLDAMFHQMRQASTSQPAVLIRLLEVLAEVAAVERDPDRRRALRRHVELAAEAGGGGGRDRAVREDIAQRRTRALSMLAGGEEATASPARPIDRAQAVRGRGGDEHAARGRAAAGETY